MEPAVRQFTYEELESITDGFSAKNFVGDSKYGKLFRGEVHLGNSLSETKEVIVKIWIVENLYMSLLHRHQFRQQTEIKLLTESNLKEHPCLVKMIGYCSEQENLGAVYDIRSWDTVRNLIPQENFKWLARIKVAIGFACLLESMHNEEIMLSNINAAHIIVDRAFNPKLLDSGMINGGGFNKVPSLFIELSTPGYDDPNLCMTGSCFKTDVFEFGCLLLELITMRVAYKPEEEATIGLDIYIHHWAKQEFKRLKSKPKSLLQLTKKVLYNKKKESLVHKSLVMEPFFDATDGVEITNLAMQCLHDIAAKRPSMKEVVSRLKALTVVCKFSDLLGITMM